MLVRLATVGSGSPDDPIRVLLPTYDGLEIDPVTGLAIVHVPDLILPPNLPAPGPGDVLNTPRGPVRRRLPAPAVRAWVDFLDTRYAEHMGSYDPELQ